MVYYTALVCTYKHRRSGSGLVLIQVHYPAGPRFHSSAAELQVRLLAVPRAHADQHLLHHRQLL